MTNEEKRTTGKFHHTEKSPRDYNPVQYSKYYWLKVYLLLCGLMIVIYLIVTHI